MPRQAALFPAGLHKRRRAALTTYLPASVSSEERKAIDAVDLMSQIIKGAKMERSLRSLWEDFQKPRNVFVFEPPWLENNLISYFQRTGRHDNNRLTYHNGRLYIAQTQPCAVPWLPWDFDPDTQNYWDQVHELDKTEAGKRARDLVAHLIDVYLKGDRAGTWQKYGYFDTYFYYKGDDGFHDPTAGPSYTVRFQMWPTVGTFIIEHNGEKKGIRDPRFDNELLISSPGFNFCLHPAEPYPSGDLLAMHFLFCATHGVSAFLGKANW